MCQNKLFSLSLSFSLSFTVLGIKHSENDFSALYVKE